MRRSYVISDFFYRFTHVVKRNRFSVILYALLCAVFLVIGIAIGVHVEDKISYALCNGGIIFKFLRGDAGAVVFFLTDFFLTALYAIFAAAMIYPRFLWIISFAPCMYGTYSLGMSVSIIVSVYSASALPMLFVFYVPAGIVKIAVYCIASFKCREFSALNKRCVPSKPDIKEYALSIVPYLIALAVCVLVETVTVTLFGSALIGII